MQKVEHTLKRFDVELEAIYTQIMQMGGLVETQFTNAMQSLTSSNISLAIQVIRMDKKVNQFEIEIDALCCNAIACHKPTASDLRWIVTTTKIIVHLERIGDEIKKIALMTERRAQRNQLSTTRLNEVNLAATKTQAMLKQVLDSFARTDTQSALGLIGQSDAMKKEFDIILLHLISFMTDKPHTITTSLEFFLITKALESISEHIKSIATLVINQSDRYNKDAGIPMPIALTAAN